MLTSLQNEELTRSPNRRSRFGRFLALTLLSATASGCGIGAVYPDAASGSPWVRPDEMPGARARAKRRGPRRGNGFGVLIAPRYGFESVQLQGRERVGAVAAAFEGEVHIPVAQYASIGGGIGWQGTGSGERSESSEGEAAFRWDRLYMLTYAQFVPAYPFVLRVGVGAQSDVGVIHIEDQYFKNEPGPIIVAGGGITFPCTGWEGDCLVLVEWRRTWGGMTTPVRGTESFYSDAFLGTASLVAW